MRTFGRSNINRAIRLASQSSTALVLVVACAKGSDSAKMDTAAPTGAPAVGSAASAPAPDSMTLVRGTVASVSASEVVVKNDSGASVTVTVSGPIQVFSRATGDLSHVSQNSFIGVTTVKQPDGAERATEIHIFPEELRGLGEGSRMMTPPAGAAANGSPASRMTNGAVSTASPAAATPASRMSNGNVASTNGSTLVVQYAGGSQNVTVPPTTPVTEIKLVQQPLAAGDKVVVVAKKGTDGSLSSNKALLMK
jgi:hypothetical protein